MHHTNSILNLPHAAWSPYSYSLWKNCNHVAIGISLHMKEVCGD